MSEEEVKKSRGKDAEFMRMMRERAALKRAEQKKIKDAEALKAKQAHEAKLKEADELLNPKPVEQAKPSKSKKPVKQEPEESGSEGEDVEQEVDLHKTIKKGLKPLGNEPNYKQMYYKVKLETLAAKAAQPPPQPQYNGHDIARSQIIQGVNKQLIQDMLKQYYPNR